MLGSGKNRVPDNQLGIYGPANWEVVFNGQDILRRSTTIENAPEWLIRLFQRRQKAEEDVCLLAGTTTDKDAMDIDISEMRTNYHLLSDNATSLLQEISQSMSLQNAYTGPMLQRNCQQ
jgi:hypothetical protein